MDSFAPSRSPPSILALSLYRASLLPTPVMPNQVVRYQSDLLRELIDNAELHTELSPAEADTLRQHIREADSEQDIAHVWAELDDDFQLLDEDHWAR